MYGGEGIRARRDSLRSGVDVNYALGIDVGTTFTAAATWRRGQVEAVPLGTHAHVVPSVLFLRSDQKMLVGEAAARRAVEDPSRVAREFKRRVGDRVPVRLAGHEFPAHALVAEILRWVVAKATELEGGPPDSITLTCPANWGPYRVGRMMEAARGAGLRDAHVLAEPVAAAVYYASQERVERDSLVGVYDLGGGTFDATVLRKTATSFEVYGEPAGDDHLGGVDFDQSVMQHVSQSLGDRWQALDPFDPDIAGAVEQIRTNAVLAKEALSVDVEAGIVVILPGLSTTVRVTRSEFEEAVREPLSKTVDTFRRTVADAGIVPSDLRSVLLVGGSSRIPLVAQLLMQELGVAVSVDTHPKYAVSLGAAIAAAPRLGALAQDGREEVPAGPSRTAPLATTLDGVAEDGEPGAEDGARQDRESEPRSVAAPEEDVRPLRVDLQSSGLTSAPRPAVAADTTVAVPGLDANADEDGRDTTPTSPSRRESPIEESPAEGSAGTIERSPVIDHPRRWRPSLVAAAVIAVLLIAGSAAWLPSRLGGNSLSVEGGGEQGERAAVGNPEAPAAGVDPATLRVGLVDDLYPLDPARAAAGYAIPSIQQNVGAGLMRLEPGSGKVVPDLAKECQKDPDGLTYVCKLREGLTFHDGQPLTAQHVAGSLMRMEQIAAAGSFQPWMFIADATATDDVTVRITLDAVPDALFLEKLAHPIATVVPVDTPLYSSTAGSELVRDRLISAGPYKLVDYVEGEHAELEVFDGYWGERPSMRRIRVQFYDSYSRAAGAMTRGDLDLVLATGDVAPSEHEALSLASDGMETGAAMRLRLLVFNTDYFPDAQTRRAVSALIDRDALVAATWEDVAEPAYSIVPSHFAVHTPDFTEQIDDRLNDDIDLAMVYPFREWFSVTEADALADLLEASGRIDVLAQGVSEGSLTSAVNDGDVSDFPTWIWGYEPEMPAAYIYASQLYSKDSPLNGPWANDRLQEMVQGAWSATGPDREQLFRDIQKFGATDMPMVPLYSVRNTAYYKGQLTGVAFSIDVAKHARWDLIGRSR